MAAVKQEDTVIRLSDMVAPVFRDFWKAPQPFKILKGGRSSTKSSNISLKLVRDFIQDPNGNVICFRKVGKYLSTSVYEQIKWAIHKLHLQDQFTFMKSPLRIIHDETDTAFYFYGVDDPIKIKSAKIAVGYVMALWFEEAAEFDSKEEIDTVTDTFVREVLPDDKQVDVYFSYNPPRSEYNWLNEWVQTLAADKNYYIHHSTYKDAINVLSKQFLEKVATIKLNDPEYYNWMYGGKVTGVGDTVYNIKLFKLIDEIPADDKLLFADIAVDSGYSVSSTTFLYIGYTVKRKVILLDTYYYNPKYKQAKKAPSEFSKDLYDFYKRNNEKWRLNIDTFIGDSADGALRNQVMKDYGIYLQPSNKKLNVKMVENVEDLLAQDRVRVLNIPANDIFMEEHRTYKWDMERLKTNPDDPKVIKEDDHTVDAFKYYVNTSLIKLGLKG